MIAADLKKRIKNGKINRKREDPNANAKFPHFEIKVAALFRIESRKFTGI